MFRILQHTDVFWSDADDDLFTGFRACRYRGYFQTILSNSDRLIRLDDGIQKVAGADEVGNEGI